MDSWTLCINIFEKSTKWSNIKPQVLPNYENVEGSRGARQAASPSPSMMTQVWSNIEEKIQTKPVVPRANIEQQPLKPRWRRSLRETCRLGPPLPWPPRPPTTCWPTQTPGSTTTARWSAAPPPTSRWAAAAAREPPWPPPRPRRFPPFRDSNHTQVPKYQKLEWFLRHR